MATTDVHLRRLDMVHSVWFTLDMETNQITTGAIATTALTGLTPGEIDTLWAQAEAPITALRGKRAEAARTIRKMEKWYGSGSVMVARTAMYRTRIERLDLEIAAEVEKTAPFSAEWDSRGGWSRGYVVPGGHIHRSTWCHTLRPSTSILWIPEVSGKTEDEIVEYAGIHACTVCYPTAPVDALRAAEAAAKAATSCPGSGTWDHDSSGLRYNSPRAKCNHCRATVSATSTGKLRAHKPRAAA